MRLKRYLSFDTLWGKVVDAILAHNVPHSERNVDPTVRINVFLQTWQTYQNKKQLPRLKSIMDVAKKYGLRIEGIAFSRKILRSRPIWYHKDADPEIRSMNHTAASICLRVKHGIRTVGDTLDLANKSQDPGHEQIPSCKCQQCTEIREKYNCNHPHGCINQALKLLNTLPEKWDPRSELPEDYQKQPEHTQTTEEDKRLPFDTRVTTEGSLADIFRIFTDKTLKATNTLPKLKAPPNLEELQYIVIATDGSCENNGEENAKAGAGIFISDNHPDNRSAKLPKYIAQSNQTGEIVAAKIAAEITNPNMNL
ncbi:hypothetical protein EV359DRAFT_15051, partial [Lentinula novae-zelandiae]